MARHIMAQNAVAPSAPSLGYSSLYFLIDGRLYCMDAFGNVRRADTELFDARAFGAEFDWDGSSGTDDTTPIQDAIIACHAAGGGCVLLSGYAKTTSAIRVYPKVNLIGLTSAREWGWATTTYPMSGIYNAGTGDAIVVCGDESLIETVAGVRQVIPGHTEAEYWLTCPNKTVIENLVITGNALSNNGIRIGDPTDSHPTTGPSFHQYCTAVGYNTVVRGCLVANHGNDGIHCSGAASCQIISNEMFNNGRYGLSTWVDANGYQIQGNHHQSNTSHGMHLTSLWGSSVTGNTCESSGSAEIYLTSAQGVDISGNYFEGSTSLGILIYQACFGVHISGNRFQMSANYPSTGLGRAIDIADSAAGVSDINIENNTAYNTYVVCVRSTAAAVKHLRLSHNFRYDGVSTTPASLADTYLAISYAADRIVEHDDVLIYRKVGINTSAPSTSLDVSGNITQSTYCVRGIFSKTGIADNTATGVFTVTTTNESGDTDGGAYSVFVHAVIGHSATSGNSNTAAKSFTAQFVRAVSAFGTGVNSAVSEVVETASAATTGATRDIGTVTMTVTETSEYIQTVEFTVDLTGTNVSTAEVVAVVELVYTGFTTPPVLAAA